MALSSILHVVMVVAAVGGVIGTVGSARSRSLIDIAAAMVMLASMLHMAANASDTAMISWSVVLVFAGVAQACTYRWRRNTRIDGLAGFLPRTCGPLGAVVTGALLSAMAVNHQAPVVDHHGASGALGVFASALAVGYAALMCAGLTVRAGDRPSMWVRVEYGSMLAMVVAMAVMVWVGHR